MSAGTPLVVAFYRGQPRGRRLFDRLVCWWTRGPYSHCELIIDGSTIAEIEAGQAVACASSSWLDGGVRVRTMALSAAKWDLIAAPGASSAGRRWAMAWAMAHLGERYDVLGLLGFLWRPQIGQRRRWFCSEAVAAMLGFEEPWRFDPNTLSTAVRGPCTTHDTPP